MNVLFVTISWPEEGKRNLYSDLMDKFIQEGHNVYVVSNRPRRNDKDASFAEENGIHVLRVKTGNITKTNPIEKSISLFLLGWQLKWGINKYLDDKEFDLLLFNTPPITLAGLLGYLKKKFNSPLYLLLKDIWPYGFADMGLIKRGGWIYNYFRRKEKKLYQLSDVIGCMSPKGVDFILDKHPYLDRNKVEVCPNSITVDENRTNGISDNSIRDKFGIPEDATVFIFSGNLGIGHGLDFLMESILKLKDYKEAFFLIGGAGTYYSKLEKVFAKENLPNAHLYSYLPADEYEKLIGTCDVGLILLDQKYTYPQFPSRLLSYLENKMAVLCAVNKETDIGEIVEQHNVGLNTLHGDFEQFKQSVIRLCKNRQTVKKMGAQGFELLKNKFSVEQSYKTIMKHFEE